ncbi:site-2 protease family protein [Niabella insulamsoli]|uniref:site-2 protease family protein n=1 Tax=Niabella insulamsoli TaxID=3144874 RepID=UPI0031FC9A87
MPTADTANAPTQYLTYPPRYDPEPVERRTVVLNGLYSIAIYLGLGYLMLRRWDLLLVLFGIIVLHEAGHFLAMKWYRYADLGVLFLPFIGAFVQGKKKEISQQESAVILLAGPLPGLLLGILLHFIGNAHSFVGDIPLHLIAQLLIWANLLNLLPVYPLDGGQLITRIFLNEDERYTNIFFFLSIAAIAAFAIAVQFYVLLIFPLLLLYRFFKTRRFSKLEKELDEQSLDLDKPFEELTNEEYWRIRAVVIRHINGFQQVAPGPPFEYDEKEGQIAHEVNNALQRRLIMDLSVAQRLLLSLIWAAALLLPFWLQIDFLLLQYFGR